MSSLDLKNYHNSQTKFLNDELILVDENDNSIGSISKLNGHLLSNNNKHPHRAFSIFLFDSKNRLLLQKRAQKKNYLPPTMDEHMLQSPFKYRITKYS